MIAKMYIAWKKQAYSCCPNTPCLRRLRMLAAHKGRKKQKKRVSLVVCANATETHKISYTLIEKAKFPACIKNQKWPVKYISQNKAWMDVSTC